MQVERHNVSQRQNQHHHIYQMTWKANERTLTLPAEVKNKAHALDH